MITDRVVENLRRVFSTRTWYLDSGVTQEQRTHYIGEPDYSRRCRTQGYKKGGPGDTHLRDHLWGLLPYALSRHLARLTMVFTMSFLPTVHHSPS
jgi:hypothetical protein